MSRRITRVSFYNTRKHFFKNILSGCMFFQRFPVFAIQEALLSASIFVSKVQYQIFCFRYTAENFESECERARFEQASICVSFCKQFQWKKGQILGGLLNGMGPFDTPIMFDHLTYFFPSFPRPQTDNERVYCYRCGVMKNSIQCIYDSRPASVLSTG